MIAAGDSLPEIGFPTPLVVIGVIFGLIVVGLAVAFGISLFQWIRDRQPDQHGFEVKPTIGVTPVPEKRENDHG